MSCHQSFLIAFAGLLVCLAKPCCGAAPENTAGESVRKWSDSTGRFSAIGVLVDGDQTSVRIKKQATGTTITVAVARLSKADRDFLAQALESARTNRSPAGTQNGQADSPPAGATAKWPAAWFSKLTPSRPDARSQREGEPIDLGPLLSASAERIPENMIYVRLSRAFLQKLVYREVSRQAEINDSILGRPVVGIAQVSAHTEFALQPHAHAAVGQLRFLGTETHQTVAYAGPVQLYYRGATQFQSEKSVWLDGQGIHLAPAVSTAQSQSTLTGIQTSLPRLRGRIALRIAGNREAESHALAEEITSQHVRGRVDRRFDETADAELTGLWNQISRKLAAVPADHLLRPRGWYANSSKDALEIIVLGSPGNGSGYVPAPPTKMETADVMIDVHASVVKVALADPDVKQLLASVAALQITRSPTAEYLPSLRWSNDAKWLSISWQASAMSAGIAKARTARRDSRGD